MQRRTKRFVRSVKSNARRRAVPEESEESQSRNKLENFHYLLFTEIDIFNINIKTLVSQNCRESKIRKPRQKGFNAS